MVQDEGHPPARRILKDGAAFEEEAGHVEGTFAHALERIIGLFIIAAGGYRPLRYATQNPSPPAASERSVPTDAECRRPIAKRWPRDTPLVAREDLFRSGRANRGTTRAA